jgi:hypothetical protein
VLVGIHHAPAASLIAELGPGFLKVAAAATIGQPCAAGRFLCCPLPVRFFLFLGLLVNLPAVLFMVRLRVLSHQ